MSDNLTVTPIKPPTAIPDALAYFVAELCFALEGMPEQLERHGLTPV